MVEPEVIVVFPTTHLTLLAEKSLEKAGIAYRTILKPRKISSDCGLAIRIDPGAISDSRKALAGDGNVPARFFREVDGQWESIGEL